MTQIDIIRKIFQVGVLLAWSAIIIFAAITPNFVNAQTSTQEQTLSYDKEMLEIEKLKLENEKIRKDISGRWISFLESYLPFIASFVTLFTLWFSIFSWKKSRDDDRDQKERDMFNLLVARLGDSEAATRSSAAIGLSDYLKSGEKKFRLPTIRCLSYALGHEVNYIAKRAIGRALESGESDSIFYLGELQTILRQMINPKFDDVSNLGKRGASPDKIFDVKKDIESMQRSFLVSAITIANIEGNPLNLKEAPFTRMSLIEEPMYFANADFTRAYLGLADFFKSNLSGAIFSFADLPGARFQQSVLTGARFENATLANADFSGSNLSGAKFDNANLRDARFIGAILSGATFKGANVTGAAFDSGVLVDTSPNAGD